MAQVPRDLEAAERAAVQPNETQHPAWHGGPSSSEPKSKDRLCSAANPDQVGKPGRDVERGWAPDLARERVHTC